MLHSSFQISNCYATDHKETLLQYLINRYSYKNIFKALETSVSFSHMYIMSKPKTFTYWWTNINKDLLY